jgi:type I restriction enzyme S subunit
VSPIGTVRAKTLFREVVERGWDLPLASVTKDGGVELRADLDISVWNPGDDTSMYKRVLPGDFVIGLRSFQNGIGSSRLTGLVSPAYTVLRPVAPVDHRYFHHYFKSGVFISELANVAQGIRQGRTIGTEDFYNLKLRVPAIAEQRAIAGFLDRETTRIDALIAAKRRMIELLDARFQVRGHRLLTGSAEASADTWTPGPRWLGPVPRSWKPYKVASFLSTGSGTTPASDRSDYYSEEGVPWVTTAELRETVITGSAKCVTEVALREHSALKVFPPGTVLVAMYGATVGRVGVLGVHAAMNQACCAVTGDGLLSRSFLYWWLRLHRSDLLEMAYGSGQPNISQDTIRSLRVPAPDLPTQEAIARKLSEEADRNSEITSTLTRQTNLLVERRQALITAAVTSEIETEVAA